MKKILKWGAAIAAILFVMQFFGPKKTNPPVETAQTIQANTQMTPEVSAIINRACRDCHSNQTQWPWYSHVAPVSWFVIDHVNHGRSHLNFSNWAAYEPESARNLLEGIREEVEKEAMPLKSYLLMHSEAKLSDDEVKTIVEWTKAERRRLVDEKNLTSER